MRTCEWCHAKLPARLRSDAKTCSQACRQAKARFRVAPAASATADPMRFAYADPPYPGFARKLYGREEVDHAELVARLVADFPDDWALSTHARSLQAVLAVCPPGVSIASWHRGERRGRATRPRSAWEPVIYFGGRTREILPEESCCDALAWTGRQHSHPDAIVGMKPAAFCTWLFGLLGAAAGDELVDLFPGSGAVTRAWHLFVAARAATHPSQEHDGTSSEAIRRGRPSATTADAGASRRVELEATAAANRPPAEATAGTNRRGGPRATAEREPSEVLPRHVRRP